MKQRGRVTLSLILGPGLILIVAGLAQASTPMYSQNGLQVKWPGRPNYQAGGYALNQTGLSPAQLASVVPRTLQRWKEASQEYFQFDYWQGTDAASYEPNSNYNGVSSVYFSSQSGAGLGSGVLGQTQVWYNTSNGEILEADIALNDSQYRFSLNPHDVSGGTIFLENVLTHELGHVFGLSHSGTLQATMLYLVAAEQFHLSCDEYTGVSGLYPVSSSRGKLSGVVTAENGQAIFGAQVLAISAHRGVVLGASLTGKDGSYTIHGLEPGAYYLMVEPFYAGGSTLSPYFSSLNHAVCSGRLYSRNFLMSPDGVHLQELNVSTGQNSQAPALVASCSPVPVLSSVESFWDSTAGSDSPYSAIAGRFSSSPSVSYRLNHPSQGPLRLRSLSFSLYSPTAITLTLTDAVGAKITPTFADRSYYGTSGFVNYDYLWEVQDLPAGDYWVQLAGKKLESINYPAGSVSLDPYAFFVLTASRNMEQPGLAGEIPYNARCLSQENFPNYQVKSGPPPRKAPPAAQTTTKEVKKKTGFCGTVDDESGPTQPPQAADIVAWFLPFIFCAGLYVRMRRLSLMRV